MRPTSDRSGISKLAIPIVVVVMIVAGGAYVFLAQSSTTSSQTSSTSSLPTVPVSTAVDQLVQDLKARNVAGMVTFYRPNAVDVWSGNTGGLSGLYTGTDDIKLIYATTVGKSTTLDANVSQYAEHPINPTNINATFVISMLANSTVAGVVTAQIDVSQAWTWGGGGWQILKENWQYKHYDSSFIDAGLPASATTFPQWRLMEEGKNPNLVSEKSFEWHAGPYIAASVYAFVFGIVAYTALRFRSMNRRF